MDRHGIPFGLRGLTRTLEESFKEKMLKIWEQRGLYVGAEVRMGIWIYVIRGQAHDGYALVSRKGSSDNAKLIPEHPNDLTLVR